MLIGQLIVVSFESEEAAQEALHALRTVPQRWRRGDLGRRRHQEGPGRQDPRQRHARQGRGHRGGDRRRSRSAPVDLLPRPGDRAGRDRRRARRARLERPGRQGLHPRGQREARCRAQRALRAARQRPRVGGPRRPASRSRAARSSRPRSTRSSRSRCRRPSSKPTRRGRATFLEADLAGAPAGLTARCAGDRPGPRASVRR